MGPAAKGNKSLWLFRFNLFESNDKNMIERRNKTKKDPPPWTWLLPLNHCVVW